MATEGPSRAPVGITGICLALAIVGGWTSLHVCGVFVWPLSELGAGGAVAIILLQTWLSVGLFIVAHDCMHGSLAPSHPRVNACLGTLCAFVYCGFRYRSLRRAHFAHHEAPGTADDPDFHAPAPRVFLGWYWSFLVHYFGWRQVAFLCGVLFVEIVLLRAPMANVLLFWATPAIMSSLQLFVFGTWLPHRHRADSFVDRHRARTVDLPWLASLLTCFHFGYHHEHHLRPGIPWWGLPRARRAHVRSVD